MALQARLNILSGKRQGEVVDLEPGSYDIGTRKAAAIQLRDKGIGFKHAVLVVGDDGQAAIEDLKSAGGTFVDGAPVKGTAPLAAGQPFQVGTVELLLELAGVAAAPEPEPEPEPEPAPAPDPAPAAAAAAAAAAVPDDLDLLKEQCRTLQRQLAEKTQEAQAYADALESQSASGGGGAYDDGLGGYSETASADLEVRILELQQIADEQTAQALEKDETIRALERELDVFRKKSATAIEDVKREQEAMARDVMRGHERLEEWRTEVDDARSEVARFEAINAELLLENEELKEKVEGLRYQIEQEASKRGELVRVRVVELRSEIERLENSNVELQTLVEAYEEKIDELDERVEEVEGENEAQQAVVEDLRDELAKAKHEAETRAKALRKKVQSLEMQVERLQGESARARAAAET